MRLADHVGPPAEHREEDAEQAGEEDIGARRILVHPHDSARRHGERGEAADERPDARRQNVEIVGLGSGHVSSRPVSCLPAKAGIQSLWLGPGFGSRSEEHTSELQSLMRISYAVFCLKKKKLHNYPTRITTHYTTIRYRATHLSMYN